jgi:hypothetical protein
LAQFFFGAQARPGGDGAIGNGGLDMVGQIGCSARQDTSGFPRILQRFPLERNRRGHPANRKERYERSE